MRDKEELELIKANNKFASGRDVQVGDRYGNVSDNCSHCDHIEIVFYDKMRVERLEKWLYEIKPAKSFAVDTFISHFMSTPKKYRSDD